MLHQRNIVGLRKAHARRHFGGAVGTELELLELTQLVFPKRGITLLLFGIVFTDDRREQRELGVHMPSEPQKVLGFDFLVLCRLFQHFGAVSHIEHQLVERMDGKHCREFFLAVLGNGKIPETDGHRRAPESGSLLCRADRFVDVAQLGKPVLSLEPVGYRDVLREQRVQKSFVPSLRLRADFAVPAVGVRPCNVIRQFGHFAQNMPVFLLNALKDIDIRFGDFL